MVDCAYVLSQVNACRLIARLYVLGLQTALHCITEHDVEQLTSAQWAHVLLSIPGQLGRQLGRDVVFGAYAILLLSVYTSLCNPKSAGTVFRYDKIGDILYQIRSDILCRLGQGFPARVPPPEVKPSGCLTAMLCWPNSEVHALNNLTSHWHDIPLPCLRTIEQVLCRLSHNPNHVAGSYSGLHLLGLQIAHSFWPSVRLSARKKASIICLDWPESLYLLEPIELEISAV